jgi:hypothetical protein
LKIGESISKFDTGTEISSIRLDNVEDSESAKPVVYNRDRIKELLSNYQRSREVDRWIHDLHANASIVVHDEEKPHD